MKARNAALCVVACLLTSCSGSDGRSGAPWSSVKDAAGNEPSSSAAVAEGCATSEAESLLWKRGSALANDLQEALALPADQLCNELGQRACADVHRVPLGMSDPFGSGLYDAVHRPLATTAIATDRVVLSACGARVERDKAGESAVFKDGILSARSLSDDAAKKIVQTLYRRLLTREPREAELAVLRELTKSAEGEPLSAEDFAQLACFTIGTTSEFLLY